MHSSYLKIVNLSNYDLSIVVCNGNDFEADCTSCISGKVNSYLRKTCTGCARICHTVSLTNIVINIASVSSSYCPINESRLSNSLTVYRCYANLVGCNTTGNDAFQIFYYLPI